MTRSRTTPLAVKSPGRWVVEREAATLYVPSAATIRDWRRRGLLTVRADAGLKSLKRAHGTSVMVETEQPFEPPVASGLGRPLELGDPWSVVTAAIERIEGPGRREIAYDHVIATEIGLSQSWLEKQRRAGRVPPARGRRRKG